ncbi:protein O-mannosyl-transferase family [Sandaracinus amylolyticus]|uniref:DUF2723 domain-containing protein n=1 Tax=Sandaracinus amylolyticus TaxID=927083 RepID=A0A0F6W5L4_9BACT|nr:DUF2723 domain-containing protein [Sandaracinus amylolyticus]AKF07998.1 Hypothetical protein DB32_005147 [Sandaracinus amylolyticus]
MSSTRGLEAALLVVAGIALTWGAAASPHVFDAGELVAAAAQLGAGHPPGQPLHALLGYAATLVPLGPLAWRIALLSAAMGLWAAHEAAGIVRDAIERDDRGARVLPAVTALAVLVAPAIAPQLARPEVYTLALALALAGARRLIAWACGDRRALRIAAMLAGLAVAVHPPHALALVAIGAVALIGWRRDAWRGVGWAALACVIGLGAIAYLPVRAIAGARTWGDPTTLDGIVAYLSGRAYGANLGARSGSWAAVIVEPIVYVLIGAGVGVAIAVLARARSKRVVVIGAAACAAIVGACLQPHEPANPDNVAYAAPAMALLLALGGAALATSRAHRGALSVGALALVIAPLATSDVASALRAEQTHLETLAFSLVDAPPPRALVVTRSDFVAAAWMQARDVEGARPDVAVMVEGLATSSWHWRSLAGHPRFDGTPARGAGSGRAAWVRGAIDRALGHVAIVSEHDEPVSGRGTVLGAYLVLPTDATGVERAFAERTAGASARAMRDVPAWYGGLGHGVVRDVELARASRWLVRDHAPLAIAALRRASAPLPPDVTAIAEGITASPRRAPPPRVDDPTAIFATAEDAVRALATVLVALGEPERAMQLLEAQATRGDDRALLQLAWIQLGDGLVEPARAAVSRYRALHPDREHELEALGARLR